MNQSGGGNGNSLHYSNVVIAASDFVEYTTTLGTEEEKLYNLGYTYKANVAITDCLEVMIPEATLSLPEIESSGVEVASQINCYNGGVTFYANGAPTNDITILSLELSWSDEIVDVEDILTPSDIGAIPESEKGIPGGVATLDADGRLSQGRGTGNSLIYYNLSFAAANFQSFSAEDEEEAELINMGYVYRAGLALNGAMEEMVPDVVFSLFNVESAGVKLSNQLKCYDGGVYAYADGVPANDIEVLTLELSWNDINPDLENMLTAENLNAIPVSEKGVASGVATLDESGKVPETQLPAIGGAVESVNGQVGVVELTADDVNAAPAIQSGTEELVDGISELPYGVLYCLIEE